MVKIPAVEVYAELNRVRSPGGADFVIRNCLVTPCPPRLPLAFCRWCGWWSLSAKQKTPAWMTKQALFGNMSYLTV